MVQVSDGIVVVMMMVVGGQLYLTLRHQWQCK